MQIWTCKFQKIDIKKLTFKFDVSKKKIAQKLHILNVFPYLQCLLSLFLQFGLGLLRDSSPLAQHIFVFFWSVLGLPVGVHLSMSTGYVVAACDLTQIFFSNHARPVAIRRAGVVD